MALILGGVAYEVPGLAVRSWRDDPRIPAATDTNARRERISGIVLHTTSGKRGPVLAAPAPGAPVDADVAYARYQASAPDHKSWDFTVDRDGSVAQSSDPLERATWHAGNTPVNNRSVGIEIVQDKDGTLYRPGIDSAVKLVNFLTARLGIQRQYPARNGQPDGRHVERLLAGGGRDFYGVYGHRNTATDRGWGDPGDPVFDALSAEGYEGFDLDRGEDMAAWRARQASLGVAPADGIPGDRTVAALRTKGYADGLWVRARSDRSRAIASWGALALGVGLGAGGALAYRRWRARPVR
jgi:hypothetical protein